MGHGLARPFLRWFASARSSRFTRVALERLEDRCVAAVLSGETLDAGSASWIEEAAPAEEEVAPPAVLDEVFAENPDYRDVPDLAPGAREEAADALASPEGEPADPCVVMSGEPPSPAVGPAAKRGDAVTPVVTPRLVLPDAPAPFRITRTPAAGPAIEVPYTLTAFGSGGAVGRERVATFAPGAADVAVPTDLPAGGHEVVTLKLLDGGDYRIGRPSVSLFLAGDARACSDAALVEAYRRGESPEAFAALVERNHAAVLRTCHRVLGDWHDAEDVSQFVFLALGRRQMRLQTTLAGWLRTVARNASIALLRARNRRARHERAAAKPLQAPEDASRDHREELDAALERLAAPLRDAVRLRYLDGWSQLEAAQRVGCPRGTLSQRAALGIHHLRALLDRK